MKDLPGEVLSFAPLCWSWTHGRFGQYTPTLIESAIGYVRHLENVTDGLASSNHRLACDGDCQEKVSES